MRHFLKFFYDHVGLHIKTFLLGFCGFGSIYSTFILHIPDLNRSDRYVLAVFVVKTLVGIVGSVTAGMILSVWKEKREQKKQTKINNDKISNDEQKRA